MAERFCCARWTSSSTCWRVSDSVFWTGGIRRWWNTRFPGWFGKGSTASRLAAKTSTIMSNCGQTPCSAFWLEKEDMAEPLAGKSTLNRMELGTGINSRYKKITFWKEAVDELLVNAFIESHQEAPAGIVLDRDTTDMPLHGKQEGRFFHGYYDAYCYLPLYVFCGDHVLCARMREANHDAAFGCRQEMERIVKQLRTAWPEVRIVLRGDSGFCRNELMSWCEASGVEFVFGMARNQRLRKIIGAQMHEATGQWNKTGKPARVFTEFDYQTGKTKKGGWDRERRVVAKAEHIDGKENPRFIVTSLTEEGRKL